ncbi:11907_t:CDS:1, partial [Acaulospora morrowiae]
VTQPGSYKCWDLEWQISVGLQVLHGNVPSNGLMRNFLFLTEDFLITSQNG